MKVFLIIVLIVAVIAACVFAFIKWTIKRTSRDGFYFFTIIILRVNNDEVRGIIFQRTGIPFSSSATNNKYNNLSYVNGMGTKVIGCMDNCDKLPWYIKDTTKVIDCGTDVEKFISEIENPSNTPSDLDVIDDM